MKFKSGVRLRGLVPQMAIAGQVVEEVFREFGVPCMLTSGNDSKHGAGSLHHCLEGKYTDGRCRANDYRTKYPELNGREQELRDRVKAALGDDFDVVIEDIGEDDEHLHVEYDPK